MLSSCKAFILLKINPLNRNQLEKICFFRYGFWQNINTKKVKMYLSMDKRIKKTLFIMIDDL